MSMRIPASLAFAAALPLALSLSTQAAPQTPATAAAPRPAAAPPTPASYTGSWAYNEQESINVLTGRPERATAKTSGGALPSGGEIGPGGAGSGPPDPGSGRITQCVGCQGTSGGDPRAGAIITAANDAAAKAGANRPNYIEPADSATRMAMESRGLVRDLTEIAEKLTVASSKDAMTITDDLGRSDTFPANGRKQTHHLSASTFDATSRWNDGRLEQTLTAAQGFKMTRVLLASSDGQRLFFLFRLGDSRVTKVDMPSTVITRPGAQTTGASATEHTEGVPAAGANRVYDRAK